MDWSINPQYYYGWAVPFLALGLFHLRWKNRPAASPGEFPGVAWLSALALAALLPIRLIEEANPEWRLILWSHAATMVVITLGAIHYAGGWPWVRHFAFPVCFFLVAVPWPVPMELLFIQNLMRTIASMTVEVVGWFNIPAVNYGGVIQISAGYVGIDEACSGVRSIQTTLFASLFLGEIYRLSWPRRMALTAASIILALIANLARTVFLVWYASAKGLGRLHDVHDTAGLAALALTMLGLWGLTRLCNRKTGDKPNSPVVSDQPSQGRSLPRICLLAVAAWIAMAECSTQLWYHIHESRLAENTRWSVNWPSESHGFKDVPLSETVRAVLRYTDGRAGAWRDESANAWQMFHFRWAPGRNSSQLAKTHTPDICLRGIGYALASDLGTRAIVTRDLLALPFRQSVFTRLDEPPLHVFYCLWEEHPLSGPGSKELDEGVLNVHNRLRAVFEGRRHLGQQVLEIAIRGPASADEAFLLFQAELGNLVKKA